jgi:hypothetical protein
MWEHAKLGERPRLTPQGSSAGGKIPQNTYRNLKRSWLLNVKNKNFIIWKKFILWK